MPVYEYRCQSCSKVSEHFQKIGSPAPDACPKCAAGPLTKLISLTSFQLQGSGWFKDGYSAPAPSATEKKEVSPSASDKGTDSSSTPATTKETGASNANASTESSTSKTSEPATPKKVESSSSAT